MLAQTGVDGVTRRPRRDRQSLDFPPGPRLGRRPAGRRRPEPRRAARGALPEHYRLAEELYGPKRTLLSDAEVRHQYARLHPRHEEVRAGFALAEDPRTSGTRCWSSGTAVRPAAESRRNPSPKEESVGVAWQGFCPRNILH